MKKNKAQDNNNYIVAKNKKAKFNYIIENTYEAGIVLTGSEIKSLRKNSASISDGFVTFSDDYEMFLNNIFIAEYKFSAGFFAHSPKRKRKLLMHHKEIVKLKKALDTKGISIVPTKIYFKNGIAKVEVAVGKGKKLYDKRDAIKQRDVDRDLNRRYK
ncbi:MAG: SsrA-binding protein SmpB [Bifidobacteriaceae bacterium]|jgi:SsrA-binding protein|nr:SsrA-binding protein SmpB [Bifidobacteriaceae bacterium]